MPARGPSRHHDHQPAMPPASSHASRVRGLPAAKMGNNRPCAAHERNTAVRERFHAGVRRRTRKDNISNDRSPRPLPPSARAGPCGGCSPRPAQRLCSPSPDCQEQRRFASDGPAGRSWRSRAARHHQTAAPARHPGAGGPFPQLDHPALRGGRSSRRESRSPAARGAGWQRFAAPQAQAAATPPARHISSRRAPTRSPFSCRRRRRTTMRRRSATPRYPLTRDLPFPAKATDIRFSASPLHLDAVTPQPHGALLSFYRTELAAAGWTLHSASDGSAAMTIPTGEGMHHAFFTHPAAGAIHVTARSVGEDRRSAIRAVPASVLPGARETRPAAPPRPLRPLIRRQQPMPRSAVRSTRSRKI